MEYTNKEDEFTSDRCSTSAGSSTPTSSSTSTEATNDELDMELLKAKAAGVHEHSLSVKDALKEYRPAMGWALLFSLGVVMAGFDPQLIGTLIAVPAFKKDFGTLYNGSYYIAAAWQSGFNLAVPIGQVLGAFLIGYPLEKYGRRMALGICCVLTAVGIAIQVTARNRPQILIAEIINGLVRGGYPVIATTYISEVTPLALRDIGGALINLAFVIGQLVASAVLAAFQSRMDRWAYGIPFAIQWVFPVIILCLLPLCPRSPWWLVRTGKIDEARRSLERLTSSGTDVEILLSNIRVTTQLESQQHNTATFVDCFKSTDRRRTLISTVVFAAQPLVGSFLMISYATYFCELAGMPTADSFYIGIGMLVVGLIGTVLSWPLFNHFGRRRIFNIGLVSCTVLVVIVGVLDVLPGYNSRITWVQTAFMGIYNFAYDLTVGPICYIILCEVSSARLRGKTIAVATGVNALVNLVCAVAVPYGMSPEDGNLRGKLAFVFLGTAVPCVIWCLFALPETKGRTFEELDRMFRLRVSCATIQTFQH